MFKLLLCWIFALFNPSFSYNSRECLCFELKYLNRARYLDPMKSVAAPWFGSFIRVGCLRGVIGAYIQIMLADNWNECIWIQTIEIILFWKYEGLSAIFEGHCKIRKNEEKQFSRITLYDQNLCIRSFWTKSKIPKLSKLSQNHGFGLRLYMYLVLM